MRNNYEFVLCNLCDLIFLFVETKLRNDSKKMQKKKKLVKHVTVLIKSKNYEKKRKNTAKKKWKKY